MGLIGRDNPVDRQVLAELGELITIFPYFQTAHLLLLKGLRDNQDIRFDNQLKISAIHIADREVLYNLLKITPEAGITEKEPVREPDIISVVTQQEHQAEAGTVLSGAAEIQPQEPIITESSISEPEPVSREQRDNPVPETSEIQVDLEQTVLDSAKNSEDLISEIEKISSQISKLSSAGHQIALHVHPHWEDCKFDGDKWIIDTKRYKLSDFSNYIPLRSQQHIFNQLLG